MEKEFIRRIENGKVTLPEEYKGKNVIIQKSITHNILFVFLEDQFLVYTKNWLSNIKQAKLPIKFINNLERKYYANLNIEKDISNDSKLKFNSKELKDLKINDGAYLFIENDRCVIANKKSDYEKLNEIKKRCK